MAIFNSYVKLPEGKTNKLCFARHGQTGSARPCLKFQVEYVAIDEPAEF